MLKGRKMPPTVAHPTESWTDDGNVPTIAVEELFGTHLPHIRSRIGNDPGRSALDQLHGAERAGLISRVRQGRVCAAGRLLGTIRVFYRATPLRFLSRQILVAL